MRLASCVWLCVTGRARPPRTGFSREEAGELDEEALNFDDERLEQCLLLVGVHSFGMPLDRHHKSILRLDSFDSAVGRSGGDEESVTENVDGLVMEAVHGATLGSIYLRESAFWLYDDFV